MPDAPRKTLAEAIPELRRPFTPEAIRWKVQTVFKDAKGCILVPYIDARLVEERLNHVVPDDWEPRYTGVEGQPDMLWCHLSVCDTVRSDVGEGQGATAGMKRKAAVSDALKRAAVHFGVGVSVYALPEVRWFTSDAGPRLERTTTGQGKPSLKLTSDGFKSLRDSYGKWLERQKVFGDPLDHGDVEGQEIDDSEMEEFVPAAPAALTDNRAKALIARANDLWENQFDHKVLTKARYEAWRDGAAHSHEDLERLVKHLEQRAGMGGAT